MSRESGDERKGSAESEGEIIAQPMEAMEQIQSPMKTMPSEKQQQVRAKWRSILSKLQAAKVMDEITQYEYTFRRALESTRGIATSLTQELSEAVQQEERPQQMMQRFIDHLLRQEQLDIVEDWEDKTFEAFSAELGSKWDTITCREEEDYLQNVALADERQRSERSSKVTLDYHIAREDMKQQFKRETNATYTDLKDTLQKLVNKYPGKERRYDREIPISFQCSEKILQKTRDSITALRTQMGTESEYEETLRDLRADLKEVTDMTTELRNKISMDQAARKKRLVSLIHQGNTNTNELQKFIGKSERLLRLAKMCSKFETEQEKLPSSFASSLDAEELSQEKACTSMDASPEHILVQEIRDNSAALEIFWRRYNKVQLEYLCLKKEKSDLEQELEQLKHRIQEKQLEELMQL